MENKNIKFCNSPLWNATSFEIEQPDFSSCFQKTVLIWIPILILCIYSPISVVFSLKNNNKNLPINYSWRFLAKILFTVFLIGVEILNFLIDLIDSLNSKDVYLVNFVKPIILIITYIYVILLMYIFNRNRQKFSIVITTFWTTLILSSSIILRSKILNYNNQKSTNKEINLFILSITSFILILVNWFVSFFSEYKEKIDHKLYPESNANLLSWLTFNWINRLIYRGYKKNLSRDDVWNLDEDNSSKALGDEIEMEWNKLVAEYQTKRKRKVNSRRKNNSKIYEELKLNETYDLDDTDSKKLRNTRKPSLGFCIFRIHLKNILMASTLVLTHDMLDITGPLILDGLINFVSNEKSPKIIGFFYAGILFIRLVLLSIFLAHNYNYAFLAGVRTRSSLMNLIYRKSLRLSNESRRKATTGEILNLMQVNTHKFVELSMHGHQVWSCPIKIIAASVLLWHYIGPAVFAGLGVMAILAPLNSIFMTNYSKAETEKLKHQDAKMKTLNEILNGIKMIKFYGWEISFEKLINKIRQKELSFLRKASILYGCFNFSFGFISFAVTFVSLLTYIYINDNNVLTPNVVFVSLSLFNAIRIPLFVFGSAISNLIQTFVSLERIRDFLFLEEIDNDQISHDPNLENPIEFKKASFSWSKNSQSSALNNINFIVPKGKLIAIVGKVGAGKSSLLSSILGEMYKKSGNLNVDGSISYVPQQAWIQNATVKENIIFGNIYDDQLYQKCIKSCALLTDLNILTAGDKTEIGEKGINLSGGQKQRISLARAVYNNSDIYLFDDPLSAVDAHVGKHIFENVIGPNGILKSKTRLLVTNAVSFLPEVDIIIMLENGNMIENGTYSDLVKENSHFSKFLSNAFVNEQVENNIEENETEENTRKLSCNKENDEDILHETEKYGKLIEIEKIEIGNLKFKTVLDYFESTSFLLTFLFFVCYILMNVFYALSSFWLTQWTNANVSESGDTMTKTFRILTYGLLGTGQHFFSFISELIAVKMIMNSSRNLHQNMLKSIMHSTMQFFESTPIGRILNRFSKDLNSIEVVIPIFFKDFFYCLFDLITASIVISISTPLFLTVLAPIAIVYFIIQRFYVSSSSKLKRLDSASKSPIFSHFGETLNGISTIKAYKAQHRFINAIEQKIDYNNSFFYPNTVSSRWSAIRLEVIGHFMALFAFIFAIIAKGNLSPGIIGMSITFALNISTMMRLTVKCAAELESNLTSVERIKEYCNTPQEAEWENKDYKPDPEWPHIGEIKFKDYSVRYREDLDYALKNLSFVIKPAEKIGIVGRTGAGKSSLSLSLFRLLESKEGEIIIDGMNIKRMGLHDLRRKLTIIPQDPVLFSGTLRMNLDPFEKSSDDQIWDALEKAHLKNFVENLDNKLMFECSEGGENLSVGQRQLLCLARALLRNSKILLLDEATAAIDHNTDEMIQQTIRSSFAECTMLTIAHRLNTILDSDRIIVLDNGRIVEFDTPENLLANKNSIFYSMALTASIVKEI